MRSSITKLSIAASMALATTACAPDEKEIAAAQEAMKACALQVTGMNVTATVVVPENPKANLQPDFRVTQQMIFDPKTEKRTITFGGENDVVMKPKSIARVFTGQSGKVSVVEIMYGDLPDKGLSNRKIETPLQLPPEQDVSQNLQTCAKDAYATLKL
ncbi:MAG: hypothetical protein DI551_03930 [Micavibrio aeruginosavorus]|uniref:Lipoprotein n=1 Tax=Micavibrio aeruginosavorus TaxID=349221 RepID=A0A2W5Q6Q9_9BACT|nr:MAG: hypothetical protein DI551_03930 [Micavibrio aeruginosavorus]